MKINSTTLKAIENSYKVQSSNTYSKNKIEKTSDRVELSQTSKYLSKIILCDEKIDTKKVNEIKSKIELGTYNVDSKSIAMKIIGSIKGDNDK